MAEAEIDRQFLQSNFHKLCRFCLKLTRTTQQFQELIADTTKCHKLALLGLAIEMPTDDIMPVAVCTYCYDFIHELNEFHRICQESYRTLIDLKTDGMPELKQEIEDDEESGLESYELVEVVYATDPEETPRNEDTSNRINGRQFKQCNICGKIIKNLKEHMLTHNQQKNYQCHHCNKLFGDKSNMAKHMRIHFNIRNYICQICARTFIIASSLRKHMQTHREKVPCNLCSRTFKNDKFLAIHFRTHTLDTAYECVPCRRSFATEPALISHNRIHDKNRKEPKRERRPREMVVISVSRE